MTTTKPAPDAVSVLLTFQGHGNPFDHVTEELLLLPGNPSALAADRSTRDMVAAQVQLWAAEAKVVTAEPVAPVVWRVTAVPEDCAVDMVGSLYRLCGNQWQTRADSGCWVASGWVSPGEMQGAGYQLTPVSGEAASDVG